jgi:hypothetical protein
LIYFKFFLAAFLSATAFCLGFHYLGGLESPNWVVLHGAMTGAGLGGLWVGYGYGVNQEDA